MKTIHGGKPRNSRTLNSILPSGLDRPKNMMHSTVEFPKSPRAGASQVLPLEIQLERPAETRSAAGKFRRIIVACEILADLLTITLAIRLGYLAYGATAIGKHVHF